ncbi:MAG: DUF4349 domain-containing protein [Candidatus Promineofilum sp.]|nr:DUF4349 domain-containing protein [Promineifilum sp.]
MKRQLFSMIMLIVVALAVVACGGRADQSAAVERPVTETISEEYGGSAPAAMPMAEGEFVANDSSGQIPAPAGQERLIIRTADMSIVATDTEQALAQIAAMADSSSGWVVESSVYQSTDTAKSGYIRIRVPAEGFQSVLDSIAGLAVEVTNLTTSGQDVTEEFVDLSARLGNMEATAARLRQFLADSKNVEEALAVNVELSRVEGEIESLQGRIQFLQQSSDFSSINVNVTPDVLAQPIRVGGWQPSGVAKEAIEALVSMLQVLANAVIWFVLFALPILLVIAIPFVLLIWLIKRLRRRERAAEATTVESPRE